MRNHLRRLVTLAVVAALVAPVVFNRDSFPLSTYPMYARQRGDDVLFHTAVGIDADGQPQPLGLEVIGQSDDPLIVASLVRQTARAGGAALEQFCTDVAQRTVEDSPDAYQRVDVVAERHDVVARATDRPSILERDVLATCEVPSDP